MGDTQCTAGALDLKRLSLSLAGHRLMELTATMRKTLAMTAPTATWMKSMVTPLATAPMDMSWLTTFSRPPLDTTVTLLALPMASHLQSLKSIHNGSTYPCLQYHLNLYSLV